MFFEYNESPTLCQYLNSQTIYEFAKLRSLAPICPIFNQFCDHLKYFTVGDVYNQCICDFSECEMIHDFAKSLRTSNIAISTKVRNLSEVAKSHTKCEVADPQPTMHARFQASSETRPNSEIVHEFRFCGHDETFILGRFLEISKHSRCEWTLSTMPCRIQMRANFLHED